ncbi:MAG: glycoside hydrolase family 3 N-terminal domain-containing protein [Cyclobacteriaceae bacterium]
MKISLLSKLLIQILVYTPLIGFSQSVLPYKNPKFSIEKRVEDLLGRMTTEEKFWQLFMIPENFDEKSKERYKNGIFGFQVSTGSKGTDAAQQMLNYSSSENGLQLLQKINSIQKYFVEETRLGIPIIAFDETLHGLVRDGATSFPQAVALAATFDTALMKKVSHAIAVETKARGIRQVLSPVINIATDVRWGRVEETYGEDPFLTSAMGVAFVSSFEKMNIITTPKHFIANVGDGGRDSYPIHANNRLVEETHFAPFKACFNLGHSRSVMTSYNSIDGTPSTSNEWLLYKKLKQDWNFKGFVISDAGAVGGSIVLHHTAKDYPNSGEQAINSGLDVIFQTQYDHYKLFQPAFLDGRVDMKKMDEAVRRVIRAKFELGLFENPYPSEEEIKKLSSNSDHKKIAREAAQKSIVLLKNTGALPLSKNIKSVAIIGTDAIEARLGGYSGKGNNPVSILNGVKTKIKSASINFFEGCGRTTEEWKIISPDFLSFNNLSGLHAEYFNNISLAGKSIVERQDPKIDFHWTLYSPDSKINNQFYSARWTGKLKSPISGNLKIGLDGNDGFRLYLNDVTYYLTNGKNNLITLPFPIILLKRISSIILE